VESNAPNVASVNEQGVVKAERTGEATRLVRYRGRLATAPVTVLNPKPEAPLNVRGEFTPIKTSIAGTRVSEQMPMMAEHLNKATLIRLRSYTRRTLDRSTTCAIRSLTGSYQRCLRTWISGDDERKRWWWR
jgi:hypothetical protein